MSFYLSTGDAKKVCTLVEECREAWADPVAWQAQVLDFMGRELGGSHCSLVVADTSNGNILDVSEQEFTTLPLFVASGGERAVPGFERALSSACREGVAYGAVRSYSDTAEHDRSQYYQQLMRPLGLYDRACALALGRTGMHLNLSLARASHEHRFSDRETTVLGFLAETLAPRIGSKLSTRWQKGRHGLSRRESEVLDALLDGDSEKQVAARLRLGVPTVHEHVTSVYRYFSVHSRGELMAYFVRRIPADGSSLPPTS